MFYQSETNYQFQQQTSSTQSMTEYALTDISRVHYSDCECSKTEKNWGKGSMQLVSQI